MNANERIAPIAPVTWSAPSVRRAPPAGLAALAEIEGPSARVRELARAIVRRIRRRPIASIAAAVGVGVVVGGALSFRAGRYAILAAARHVARELLKQVL
jgi:hypothetical protein